MECSAFATRRRKREKESKKSLTGGYGCDIISKRPKKGPLREGRAEGNGGRKAEGTGSGAERENLENDTEKMRKKRQLILK